MSIRKLASFEENVTGIPECRNRLLIISKACSTPEQVEAPTQRGMIAEMPATPALFRLDATLLLRAAQGCVHDIAGDIVPCPEGGMMRGDPRTECFCRPRLAQQA